MEGALASVIGGLVDCPVIAVPTSVGYGASFGGLSALLAMLNSCASGCSVVNIDNGFGAGYLASMINQMEGIVAQHLGGKGGLLRHGHVAGAAGGHHNVSKRPALPGEGHGQPGDHDILQLLRQVADGSSTPEEALSRLKREPFEDLGYSSASPVSASSRSARVMARPAGIRVARQA